MSEPGYDTVNVKSVLALRQGVRRTAAQGFVTNCAYVLSMGVEDIDRHLSAQRLPCPYTPLQTVHTPH